MLLVSDVTDVFSLAHNIVDVIPLDSVIDSKHTKIFVVGKFSAGNHSIPVAFVHREVMFRIEPGFTVITPKYFLI